MKKEQIYIGLILLLLLCNLFWLYQFSSMKGDNRFETSRGELAKERFDESLSEQQKEVFDSLREDYIEQMQPILDQMHLAKIEYVEGIFESEIDREKLEEVFLRLSTMDANKDLLYFEHYETLKAECQNPEQVELLKQFMLERINSRRRKGKRRGSTR